MFDDYWLNQYREIASALRGGPFQKETDDLVGNLNQPVKATCPVVGATEVRVINKRSNRYQGNERRGFCLAALCDCPVARVGDSSEENVTLDIANGDVKSRITHCVRSRRVHGKNK
ncbi:hypothetical protein KBC75_03740 [Candidatus Shapirobacteria bacterium]|nr:hypothetical protein [Candidatus Shapirobacteria bacterium]